MTLSAGVKLGDRYELVERIAMGGMGEVWRGLDTTLQRMVAVKVLRSEFTGDATFIARFRTEARNTAMLSHTNIAQVYDYGEAMAAGEHVAYLVMELVDGDPLSASLANGARLPSAQVLDILRQTAAGLAVAHAAGVIHRDVKPANLLIRPDRVLKITDFGISRATDHVPLTGTGMVIGTAQYLSPEQAMGRPVTPSSDVYSLGVVGYEALAGRRPFDGESSVSVALAHVNQRPAPLPTDLPAAIRDLIDRAMAKNPQQRFPDGAAFAAAVSAAAKGQSPPTRPAGAAAAGTGPTQVLPGPSQSWGHSRTAVMPVVHPPRATRPAARPVSYAPPPRQPEKKRTGQWVAVVVLFALLIAGGLVAVWLTQNDGTQSATPDGSSAATTAAAPDGGAQATTPPAEEPEPEPEPELVLVDTASFIGQPFADVEAALVDLGLEVNREEVEVTAERLQDAGIEDQPFDRNDVVATDPAQAEVPPGSTVTVFVANKNYEPGAGNGDGDG